MWYTSKYILYYIQVLCFENYGVISMLYRNNPKTGEKLSILGFGCMRLPMKEDGSIDEDRAKKQVRCAIDQGVNYVDTAWPTIWERVNLLLVGLLLTDIGKR